MNDDYGRVEPMAWMEPGKPWTVEYAAWVKHRENLGEVSTRTVPLYTIPEGWQLMDMGWLRAMLHANVRRTYPEKSNEEISEAVGKFLASAPKAKGLKDA